MYAEVDSARSLRAPLLYNELKVELKQATRLDAWNFRQEKGELAVREVQQRFSGLVVFNERPGEKRQP